MSASHTVLMLLVLLGGGVQAEQYPEGYYPFHEDPLKSPPRVRKPPYTQTEDICPGVLEAPGETSLSLDNLCGDLNTGLLPRNPLGQSVLGASYPFELIKNQTLDLFSKTLPVLKEDKTLPKVAKYVTSTVPLRNRLRVVNRPTRSLHEEVGEATWSLVRSDDPFAGTLQPSQRGILATDSLAPDQDPQQHGILATDSLAPDQDPQQHGILATDSLVPDQDPQQHGIPATDSLAPDQDPQQHGILATDSLARDQDPQQHGIPATDSLARDQDPQQHGILATDSLAQDQDPQQHGIPPTDSLARDQDPQQHGTLATDSLTRDKHGSLATAPSKNLAREIFRSIDRDWVNFENVSFHGDKSARMQATGGWYKTSNVITSNGLEQKSGRTPRRMNSRDGRGLFADDDYAMWQGVLQGIFNGLKLDKKTASQIIENLEFDERMAVGRGASSFCQNNWGLFCLLYNTMMGRETTLVNPVHATERRDRVEPSGNSLEEGAPLTPCPSAVEYVTPVFARNYQGVWRYVVQIPYEGYFTQTVEITQCLEESCHYLSGSCLASPRWVSLLVAEIFYPDAVFPSKPTKPSLQRTSPKASSPHPHQRLRREAGMRPPAPHYCDGIDQIGCFQVRLYYDWFLVPGSCKCWKRNVFQQNFRHRR